MVSAFCELPIAPELIVQGDLIRINVKGGASRHKKTECLNKALGF